jgi:hypothetical protein
MGRSWIMDHNLNKLFFSPCFTLVAIISVLVLCCHSWGTGVLLGGFDKGNVLFPPILNTFHPGAFCSVLNFSMAVTCTPKMPMVHSSMRRVRMSRWMQLLEKNDTKNAIKERRNNGTMNDQLISQSST